MAIYNTNISGGLNTKDANATSADILTGKTAYVGKEKVEGEMPNNGDVSTAIENGVLKAGYTSGGQIANLTAENVAENVEIGGVVGKFNGGFSTPLTMKWFESIGRYERLTVTIPNFTSVPLVVFATNDTTGYAFGAVFSYGKLVNMWKCGTSAGVFPTFNNTTSGEAVDSDYNFIVESCTSTGFECYHTIGRGFCSVVMY